MKRRMLIMLSDDFPNRGACTSLIRNIIFDGKLRDKMDTLDVYTVKRNIKQISQEKFNGINIYRKLIWKFIDPKQLKIYFREFPLQVFWGLISKTTSKIHRALCPGSYFDNKAIKEIIRGLWESLKINYLNIY